MKQHDPVNHPTHYNKNGIEAIDVIEAYGLNFRLSNVLKYVLRHKDKGSPIQDLEKALFYLKRDIEKKKEALAKKEAKAKKELDEFKEKKNIWDYRDEVAKEREQATRASLEEQRVKEVEAKIIDALLNLSCPPPLTPKSDPDTLWTVEVYAVVEEQ